MDNSQKLEGKIDLLGQKLDKLTLLQQKSMMNLAEAAVYLGISKSTLYKHTSSGKIAHYKPNGKLILFKKGDLNYWLEGHRIPPQGEL